MAPAHRLKTTAFASRATEALSGFLLAAAFAIIQVLIGGTRLLFCLPAYGVLALIGLLALFSLRRAKPRPDQICLVSAGIFFGYVITRALLSPVAYLARPDIYSVLAGLIVYFFVACIFTGARSRLWLLLWLLVLGMVHVSIGAIQFRDGLNFMPISFLQRFDYGRRASGFYICPNHLAGLLEAIGIFGLSMICWSRWRTLSKLFIGYAVAICYVGVALTGSRGGYLSVATSLLVFGFLSLLVLKQSGSELFRRIGGAGFVAAIVIVGLSAFLIQKSDFLSGRAQNVFEKSNMRIDLWEAALQQWRLNPVLGTGSGTYRFYGREFRTARMQLDPVQVHNDYLSLLAEYGLLGAGSFAVFLFFHLRRGWRDFRRLGPNRVRVSLRLLSNGLALNIGALSAVSAYMVHSIFDFNLHIPANVLLLAFVFGILANSGVQWEPELPPADVSVVLWRLTLPIIAIVLVVQGARLWPGEYFTERSRTALRDYHPAVSISYALQGLKHEKRNPNLYFYLARARMLQGSAMANPRAAGSFYRADLAAAAAGHALAPRDETFLLELAFADDALQRFAEAEWRYSQARALDPRSTSIQGYYEGHLESWRKAGSAKAQPAAPAKAVPAPQKRPAER
jgi:O-antigen ligase